MQDQEIVVLQQEEGPLIPPGPKRVISWACNFKVPHSPPSNLGAAGCNLIKLTYCIIVRPWTVTQIHTYILLNSFATNNGGLPAHALRC